MDENSCENETSESSDGQKAKETKNEPQLDSVGIKLDLGKNTRVNTVSDHRGSSFAPSVSGPSAVFPPQVDDNDQDEIQPTLEEVPKEELIDQAQNEQIECEAGENGREQIEIQFSETQQKPEETSESVEESKQYSNTVPLMENCEDGGTTAEEPQCRGQIQSRVRLAPSVEEQLSARRPSVGPPPSYSFVMKQKKKLKPVPSVDPMITATPPPPSYAGSRGYPTSTDRICNFPSFAEPIWRSHSQPALCPRCGILVLTATHTHDSRATHVAALALCIFGCWPCCLLPYCMSICKNTYHHCPICQTFLGLYRPW